MKTWNQYTDIFFFFSHSLIFTFPYNIWFHKMKWPYLNKSQFYLSVKNIFAERKRVIHFPLWFCEWLSLQPTIPKSSSPYLIFVNFGTPPHDLGLYKYTENSVKSRRNSLNRQKKYVLYVRQEHILLERSARLNLDAKIWRRRNVLKEMMRFVVGK